MKAVTAVDITKQYGEVVALNAVSFSIRQGEIFGFIGPDGAGKTTLFRILTSFARSRARQRDGRGLRRRKDYKKLRLRIGYMPGRFSLYQDLTVEENLSFFASIFGTTVEENYDLVVDIYRQIEPFKKRRAGKLSGGMKQKLALCCALIHKPEILFLDEPTTGVDAVSRREFWDMLGRLKQGGMTIVVSTPYMDEAGRCDRVALIQKGRILDIDTPGGITAKYAQPLFAVKGKDTYGIILALRDFPHTHSVHAFGESVHYSDTRLHVDSQEIASYLREKGYSDVEVEPTAATIEDSFMELMESKHHE